MLIPELIIVESWRENTASSPAFTRLRNCSSISREPLLSAMSSTIRPRFLSWSETACLDSASSSPRAFTPARSIALKTYVLIAVETYAARRFMSRCSAPSRRLSSSGVVERDSASLCVIAPSRTSAARDASIVCMPAAELVCSTE